jgi:hypothetical protein
VLSQLHTCETSECVQSLLFNTALVWESGKPRTARLCQEGLIPRLAKPDVVAPSEAANHGIRLEHVSHASTDASTLSARGLIPSSHSPVVFPADCEIRLAPPAASRPRYRESRSKTWYLDARRTPDRVSVSNVCSGSPLAPCIMHAARFSLTAPCRQGRPVQKRKLLSHTPWGILDASITEFDTDELPRGRVSKGPEARALVPAAAAWSWTARMECRYKTLR